MEITFMYEDFFKVWLMLLWFGPASLAILPVIFDHTEVKRDGSK